MEMELKDENLFSLIEKEKFLAKKRNPSSTNIANLSTSNSPNKNLIKETLIEIDNELPKEPLKNPVNIQNINKLKLKNVKWTEKEDNLLIKYVNKYGEGKWNKIEKCFIGRTRKQIRERYINNLKIKKISENIKQTISLDSRSSSIDGKKFNEINTFIWSDRLDRILLQEYFFSKKSWVKISKKIPGTSENSVKNRFYSLLRQTVNKSKKMTLEDLFLDSPNIYKESSNNNLFFLLYKEILGNEINLENDFNNLIINKKMLFTNSEFNSKYFNNKSKKKNYSVKLLLTFLPELLEDKGIDIKEILKELNQRKNIAAIQIFVILEKHLNNNNSDNNAIKLPDAVLENLKKAQSEKLGKVISNMKLKIMSKYFHRFRYNTLGI